jgi:drug/metabolite transporter (DMT)-like permease
MSTWEINLIRFGFAQFCLSLIFICVYVYFNRNIERSSGHFSHLKNEETFELDFSNNYLDNNNNNDYNISPETSNPKTGYHVNSNLIYSQIMVYPDMKPRDWLQVTIGILFLTFATPALSNYSLLNIDMGSCLTLTSLGPIFSLPLVYIMKNEHISLRAFIGAFVSVLGIAVMYTS